MKKDLQHLIADSLECDERLLPLMPELLEDLQSLGTDPGMVVTLLERKIGPDCHVLDLACGKGAVSVALAARLGCRVTGVDGMISFIEAARKLAQEHDVNHLCDFKTGDIRAFQSENTLFDAVIYGAAGPALGDTHTCMGVLRNLVKSGGWVLIDDACRRNDLGADALVHVQDLPERESLLRNLTVFGDVPVAEINMPSIILQDINKTNMRHIECHATRVVERHLNKAALICAYVSRQYWECYILEQYCQCAIWMFRVRK